MALDHEREEQLEASRCELEAVLDDGRAEWIEEPVEAAPAVDELEEEPRKRPE